VRCINDFQITEDLAGVWSMHGHITAEEISNEATKCMSEELNPLLNKLVGICTDGVP
jgi:hypothetical protein